MGQRFSSCTGQWMVHFQRSQLGAIERSGYGYLLRVHARYVVDGGFAKLVHAVSQALGTEPSGEI
jgi:hypothetical protein